MTLKSRAKGRVSTSISPLIADGPSAEILGLIDSLHQSLEETLRSPIAQGDSADVSPVRWEDDFYVYFELPLHFRGDSQIDVNFSDGRAFIRIGR